MDASGPPSFFKPGTYYHKEPNHRRAQVTRTGKLDPFKEEIRSLLELGPRA